MTQIATPTSLTGGAWSGASTDLSDASDATYIESPGTPDLGAAFLCELAGVDAPGTLERHQIRVRAAIVPTDDLPYDLILQLENSDDDSIVSTVTYPLVPETFADYVLALDAGEVVGIHDYSGLRIRGWVAPAGGYTVIACQWDAVENATSYVLQVGTTHDGDDVYGHDVGDAVTHTVYVLVDATYYVRVIPYIGAVAQTPTAHQEVTV